VLKHLLRRDQDARLTGAGDHLQHDDRVSAELEEV
jgi:hypothetical protein